MAEVLSTDGLMGPHGISGFDHMDGHAVPIKGLIGPLKGLIGELSPFKKV